MTKFKKRLIINTYRPFVSIRYLGCLSGIRTSTGGLSRATGCSFLMSGLRVGVSRGGAMGSSLVARADTSDARSMVV